MGCGWSKSKAKKRKEQEQERQATSSNVRKVIRKKQSTNRRAYNAEQLRPLTKTFEIAKLPCDPNKPSCIYQFEIGRVPSKKDNTGNDKNKDEHKVAWRVKRIVLDEILGIWLKNRKVGSKLYLIDLRASRLYTQFVIEKPEVEFDIKFGGQGCCYKGYVDVMVPRLIGCEYVNKSEKYQIAIKSLGEHIQGLNDAVIQRAVNSLLLADVIASPSFAVFHDSRNIGRVFNLSDENHRRVGRKSACLRSCRGLATSIEPLNGSNQSLTLKLTEDLAFFFTPINMIELLVKHFKFDVSTPLRYDEIDVLECDLKGLAIEMRAGNLGNRDESLPDVHETEIGSIGVHSIREEICDSYDELGNIVGKTTVEKLFRREFPQVGLRYNHLPCLISRAGRRMPMEVCWVKRGEMIKNKYAKQEERCDPRQLQARREIFQENCSEFTKNYRSNFKQFGFQFKPPQPAKSGV